MTVWTPEVNGQKAQGWASAFSVTPKFYQEILFCQRLALEFLYSYRQVGRSVRSRRETEGGNKFL